MNECLALVVHHYQVGSVRFPPEGSAGGQGIRAWPARAATTKTTISNNNGTAQTAQKLNKTATTKSNNQSAASPTNTEAHHGGSQGSKASPKHEVARAPLAATQAFAGPTIANN